MRKYLWIAVIALTASAVYFTSCERIPKEMMDTIMPDAEQVEPPPETVETPPETTTETPPVVDMEPAETTEPMVDMEPAETTEPVVDIEPAETVDLQGGTVDIEDAMSTIGLRKIYWIDNVSLRWSNPDGSGIETIFSDRSSIDWEYSTNLVVDSEGGKIYWNTELSVDFYGGGLWRANLDGTNPERLFTAAKNFALDLEAGKIYQIAKTDSDSFALDRDHLFQRSNLDGSGIEKFKTTAVPGFTRKFGKHRL